MIISDSDLASYLDVAITPSLSLKVSLANGLIEELPVGASLSAAPPTRAIAIALEVAARAVRNPNGYSSETVDDYTYRRDADSRAAGVYLTPAERTELLGLGGAFGGTFYTVATTSPVDLP